MESILGLLAGGFLFLVIFVYINIVFPKPPKYLDEKRKNDKRTIDKIIEANKKKYYSTRKYQLLHPNVICVWRVCLALPYLYEYGNQISFWAVSIVSFCYLCDLLDGYMAGNCGLKTEVGEILDPLCDKTIFLYTMYQFVFVINIFHTIDTEKQFFWVITILEILNQTVARWAAKENGKPAAAANWGKRKARFMSIFAIYLLCVRAFPPMELEVIILIFIAGCYCLSIMSSISKTNYMDIGKKDSDFKKLMKEQKNSKFYSDKAVA